MNMQIVSSDLLDLYKFHIVAPELLHIFRKLKDAELSSDNFSFYASSAAVHSSKIEGEAIELDSYVKHKRFGIEYQPAYTCKIDDLYQAYQFAKTMRLESNSLAKAHVLLTKHILPVVNQGKFRSENVLITRKDGAIAYVAASSSDVKDAIEKLYADIDLLLKSELSIEEVFYYAGMIHLVFVKIHPWNDGNGRSARLLEKWFLAEKLGEKAWFLQSEKYYYHHHQAYYDNMRALGLEYDLLDYGQALEFLLMLPRALIGEMKPGKIVPL
ncbi:Fic family protein [Chitinophaga niabensis]|uniref:Fic family protein n=1 Tax=Chitinophaga niabensis TaxID=536979 RepID=UPI0031BA9F24